MEADGEAPVPLRVTDCGLPEALSATDNEALAAPLADGVNVTPMAQLAPAATLEPQVLVSAKAELLVPVTVMPVMVNAALPVFESVID